MCGVCGVFSVIFFASSSVSGAISAAAAVV